MISKVVLSTVNITLEFVQLESMTLSTRVINELENTR